MLKKIFLFVVCLAFTSCATCRREPDSTVLEAQRQADRLEEGIRARDRAIENCYRELEAITRRSEEMGGDIDDIIELLDLYHTTVQRLLRAAGYRTDEEQDLEEDSGEPDNSTGHHNPWYSNSVIPGTDTQN